MFYSQPASEYCHVVLSYTIFKIERYNIITVENRSRCFIANLHSTHPSEYCREVWYRKLEWWVYQVLKSLSMCFLFSTQ